MKIALISLNQIWEDKESNKTRIIPFFERASRDKGDLIIFPEMTLTGFSMNTDKTFEDIENSETLGWFQNQAKKNSINVIFINVISKYF